MPSLGRYQLEERIAQGGMGEVFRAVDTGYDGVPRTVAVKRIAAEYSREPEFVRTFKNEARLSFLLGHANVVRVLDIGDLDGTLFLVLEWVHGADLGAVLAQLRRESGQAMPTRLALTVAAEMARGLDYAHRLVGPDGEPLHLVHRDVSPSNVLLSVEGEVKISDFGIARSKLRASASLPGQLKGKLFYMAPEQANVDPLDRRADVFSLGAVLYEMLCGRNPFLGEGSEAELLDRVRRGDYPPPTDYVPTLDRELSGLVLTAMAPDREQRFSSCRELREALVDYALRRGYALSVDELGDFVRALCERHGGRLQPTSPPTVVARRQRTPPRPEATAPTEAVPIVPAATQARPVAKGPLQLFADEPRDTEREVAAPVAEPVAAAATEPEDGDVISTARHRRPATMTAQEPTGGTSPPSLSRSMAAPSPAESPAPPPVAAPLPRRAFVGAAATLVALSLVGALGAKLLRAGKEPRLEPAEAPRPAEGPATVAPPIEPPRGVPAGKALLSVDSDKPAEVYLDGAVVGTTPLHDLAVMPGSHRLKLRSTAPGLFLAPRESQISLKAGERRSVFLPVREWKGDGP